MGEARERVEVLQELVDVEDVDGRTRAFLSMVAADMAKYATEIGLEYSEGRVVLDLRRLLVVVETDRGPIPLSRIGSGQNWVGYHVIAHMALHRWFRKKARPVPGFLILDQPSQAHYPSEADEKGWMGVVKDEDRKAVRDLFDFMYRSTKEIEGFQLIVLDHAHLREEWFEESIIEEWRGDAALVPREWISNGDAVTE